MIYYKYIDDILTILNIYIILIVKKDDCLMANISNAINMSFRVDKTLKEQADELFKNLGMNTSVALNMFLTQSVREQQIPFQISMASSKPTKNLKEALQELEYAEKHPEEYKGYHNINAFIEDMLK